MVSTMRGTSIATLLGTLGGVEVSGVLWLLGLASALACPAEVVAEVEAAVSSEHPHPKRIVLPEFGGVPSIVVACTPAGDDASPSFERAPVLMSVSQPEEQSRSTRRQLRKETGEESNVAVYFMIRDSSRLPSEGTCTAMAMGGALVSVNYRFEVSPELSFTDIQPVQVRRPGS